MSPSELHTRKENAKINRNYAQIRHGRQDGAVAEQLFDDVDGHALIQAIDGEGVTENVQAFLRLVMFKMGVTSRCLFCEG